MEDPSILKIKIDVFEGPFDILFHLIEKNKVNLYDIPISEITEQYLDYIFQMQTLNLDLASEFLLMASTLLHIKSRMLLPVVKKEKDDEEDDVDPREELVLRLLEYKRYKDMTDILKQREESWSKVFYKESELFKDEYRKYLIPVIREIDICPQDLVEAYKGFCIRKKAEENRKSTEDIKVILVKDKVTVKSKIKQITGILKKSRDFVFGEVFKRNRIDPSEITAAFVALLVIVKTGKASVEQEKAFSEIHVKKIQK